MNLLHSWQLKLYIYCNQNIHCLPGPSINANCRWHTWRHGQLSGIGVALENDLEPTFVLHLEGRQELNYQSCMAIFSEMGSEFKLWVGR